MNEIYFKGVLDFIHLTSSVSILFQRCFKLFFFFFFVGLWSQSADKLTIHSIPCSWIFISQPFHKVHPPICGITAHATMPGYSFSTIFVPSFDPNEWCLKNGLHSGGLNPGPLGHESSALTTRPRLLACFKLYLFYLFSLNPASRDEGKSSTCCSLRRSASRRSRADLKLQFIY